MRTGDTELEKLWKVVEKRVKNHRNYKVARCVVEPGNVRTEISIFLSTFLAIGICIADSNVNQLDEETIVSRSLLKLAEKDKSHSLKVLILSENVKILSVRSGAVPCSQPAF